MFVARRVTIAAGGRLGYVESAWDDAIVTVECGQVELECLGGVRRSFGCGDVLWLAGLPLRALHNHGPGQTVLVALSRQAATDQEAGDMTQADPEEHVRRLAEESLAVDDPTGWFERLYLDAEAGMTSVPWDRGGPHPALVEWTTEHRPEGAGRRALVIGCGLGSDAELVAGLGFDTVAFDIAESAVREAKRRFPESAVHYVTADLLDPPPAWRHAFDLVVESLTVQALPIDLRRTAIAQVGWLVAKGGTLLVIAAAMDEDEPRDDGPPWPLTRDEVESFAGDGLRAVQIEDLQQPGVRRWRARFERDC